MTPIADLLRPLTRVHVQQKAWWKVSLSCGNGRAKAQKQRALGSRNTALTMLDSAVSLPVGTANDKAASHTELTAH